MAGAVVFLIVAVAIIGLVVLSLISPLWLILAVVSLGGWIVVGGVLSAIFGGRSGTVDPSQPEADVPTTREATYDPIQQP